MEPHGYKIYVITAGTQNKYCQFFPTNHYAAVSTGLSTIKPLCHILLYLLNPETAMAKKVPSHPLSFCLL